MEMSESFFDDRTYRMKIRLALSGLPIPRRRLREYAKQKFRTGHGYYLSTMGNGCQTAYSTLSISRFVSTALHLLVLPQMVSIFRNGNTPTVTETCNKNRPPYHNANPVARSIE